MQPPAMRRIRNPLSSFSSRSIVLLRLFSILFTTFGLSTASMHIFITIENKFPQKSACSRSARDFLFRNENVNNNTRLYRGYVVEEKAEKE